ncbi:DUF350 domain-containing protein [Paenibacillus sp. PsM32]|uniref:DUF350 domain-containing protein n=1 Tax=Paenibacillus kyungheensis TaxID=1452732 RepID=A0AAX3M2G4_9BACL|nr:MULTISPECIES: DUF350 domain-containing protein [Paenibacillus]MDN4619229.1 DUF350 domain-containing protein [Paenibacillus sp. PsM32]WCT56292.1 DUF350 domain-containing protein [Paenibacillus kyungheensis]WDF50591.1 DUF350 domain-containing protein [Paenibacillus sp. KACC 21273]
MKNFGTDLLHIGIGLVILFAVLFVGYYIFSLMTRYNDNQQIADGNQAAGMYMGSKMLGLCIIVGLVSINSDAWIDVLIWSGVGIVILCLVYLVFDWVTPRTKVCEQIEKGNMAIAQLLRSLIIGISFVIGTFVM